MQQFFSGPGPINRGNARPQTIVITALTLLALAGLLTGFTVGGFVAARQNRPNTPTFAQHPVVGQTSTPTQMATPTIKISDVGCPVIDDVNINGPVVADGVTPYAFTAHTVDKSGKCPVSGKPIEAPNITCRLWLSKIPKNGKLENLPNLNNLDQLQQQLMPDEVTGLNFDQTTPQTQFCNSKGQGNWKFTFTPAISPGQYWLVVLTDWAGQKANWSWTNPITVKSAN